MELSGPMFEGSESGSWISIHRKEGAHYNAYSLKRDEDGMKALRDFFPGAQANEMNLCFFSTSGIHGSYSTIEEAAEWIGKPDPPEDSDDYAARDVTFAIFQPRICCVRYGNCEPRTADDIAFLKN